MLTCALLGLAACGDDDDATSSDDDVTTTADDTAAAGSDTVTVEMKDYAYAISGDLVAGGTISVRNSGSEFHMMGVGKLKDGKTLSDLTEALTSGGPDDSGSDETTTSAAGGSTATTTAGATSTTAAEGEDGGEAEGGEGGGEDEDPTAEIIEEVGLPGNLVGPGLGADITLPDFGAGEYALICFLPVEGDADGAPHFTRGMIGQLNVVEGEKPDEPTPTATYKAEPGKAVEGPATLEAGKNVLLIETDEGEDLEPTLIKPDEGKSYTDLDTYFDQLGESIEKGTAANAPADLIMALFDFGTTRKVYLTADLAPGTYELVVNDTDADDGPPTPVERITITVE